MKTLIITEKCHPNSDQRDGGARVIDTLQTFLHESCDILQFGGEEKGESTYHYSYPNQDGNRFTRRLANREFIGEKIHEVSHGYSYIIFIHISMQFGLEMFPVQKEISVWTFPMFLSPSYRLSGESVPEEYFEAEKRAFTFSHAVLTPSPYEKRQIHTIYNVPEEKIFMVPRGIHDSLISKKERKLSSAIHFCSVGSIKRQKNTLGLVDLFAVIQKHFPSAFLHIVGPIQDSHYAEEVFKKIKRMDLEKQIVFTGFIDSKQLSQVLSDCHFHLSWSWCETFGRSLFETLAMGIPNIVLQGNQAAQDFLRDHPSVAFVKNNQEALETLKAMTQSYEHLSSLGKNIGDLYCDQFLGRRLVATIFSKEILAICDFDGTLFHKDDDEKTEQSLAVFQQFPVRILCSARPLSSLLQEVKHHKMEVDWIIAHSGAVVADGSGRVLRKIPLGNKEIKHLEEKTGTVFPKELERIQITLPYDRAPDIPFLRKEVYQDKAYYNHWEASKLSAICWLLKQIDWKGRVAVYGDGKYDHEMITYFDGRWIHPHPSKMGEQKELSYVKSHV